MLTPTRGSFDPSIFEVKNGKVNLTKICQAFDRRLDVWVRSKETKAFLSALKAITPNGGIEVIKGGNGEQGTFGSREVAIKLAQWISPEFEVWCVTQLDTLLQTGKVELKTTEPPKTYLEALKALVVSEEDKLSLKAKIETDQPKVEFAEALLDTTDAISMLKAVKAMHLPFGRNTLFNKLRELKILNSRNLPYNRFLKAGFFVVVEYPSPNNSDKIMVQTLVTAKGQQYILKRLTLPKSLETARLK